MYRIRFFASAVGATVLALALSACGSAASAGTNSLGCPNDLANWAAATGIVDMGALASALSTITGDIANGQDVTGSDNLPDDSGPLARAVADSLADPPMPADAGAAAGDYSQALATIKAADTAVGSADTTTAVSEYTTASSQLDAAFAALPAGCQIANPDATS